MIQIENVKKKYGNKEVLKGINLHIEKGSCTALVGRNGSGKTTFVDIICQVTKANDGKIHYPFDEKKLFDHIGVQIQDAQFDKRLKVKEIINLWTSIYGEAKADLEALIEILELKPIMNNRSDRVRRVIHKTKTTHGE